MILLEKIRDFFYFVAIQNPEYQVVIYFVIILFLTSFIIICGILISRHFNNQKETRFEQARARYEEIMTEVIFDEDFKTDQVRYNALLNQLRTELLDPINSRSFSAAALELHYNLNGESVVLLRNFYKHLNVYRRNMRLLRSGAWHDRAMATRELSSFMIKDAFDEIEANKDDYNLILRNESLIAMVLLQGIDALENFKSIKSKVTDWQQIRVLELLKKFPRRSIPKFIDWLDIENDSIKIFAIRLIKFFNQTDALDKLKTMIEYKNKLVRLEVFKALSSLGVYDFTEELKQIYERQPIKMKLEILNIIANNGSEADHEFLVNQFENKDYLIKLIAFKTLMYLDGLDKLAVVDRIYSEKEIEIIKHALDERI
jgi:hypothetical protein